MSELISTLKKVVFKEKNSLNWPASNVSLFAFLWRPVLCFPYKIIAIDICG